MGEKVVAGRFDLSDRQRYRDKLRRCLTGLERLLAEQRFDRPQNLMGLEIELNLVGTDGMPRMLNGEVLERIASRDFQTELAMFNLEVNIAPHRLGGRVFDRLAEELRTSLAYADRKAGEVDAGIVMIGILPTLDRDDLVSSNLSDVDRYTLLNDQIVAARGEDFVLDIDGVERLTCTSKSIAPEAACTSVQLHLQVTPGRFADVWNAAQAVAGVQIAVGANSPFLFGRELWCESRPPLFQQSTDTRPPELQAQGAAAHMVRERWISSAYDLFEENLRYFPALLPICDEEDPLEVLDQGGVPSLAELVLHNGTVYRWNRPVYGIADGVPHLRVENRVLPAGPTITDVIANAAFYYGLVRALAEEPRPVWSRLPFEAAAANFDAACRYGIDARMVWPRRGRHGGTVEVDAVTLVRDELLPLADAGLAGWGVEPADRDLYLGVIEERCRRRANGASWQAATFHRAREAGLSRDAALAATTRRYGELMRQGEPVHTWPVGLPEPVPLG